MIIQTILIYISCVLLSLGVFFYIMIGRINMSMDFPDFCTYLDNDCMLSNITESRIGNMLGIIYVLTVIPTLFFLMFYVMDVLRVKTYYKDIPIKKNSYSRYSSDKLFKISSKDSYFKFEDMINNIDLSHIKLSYFK